MGATGAFASASKGPVMRTMVLCSRTTDGNFAAFGWAVATARMDFRDTSCSSPNCSWGGLHPCDTKIDAKTRAIACVSPNGYAVSSLVEKWVPEAECTNSQGLC